MLKFKVFFLATGFTFLLSCTHGAKQHSNQLPLNADASFLLPQLTDEAFAVYLTNNVTHATQSEAKEFFAKQQSVGFARATQAACTKAESLACRALSRPISAVNKPKPLQKITKQSLKKSLKNGDYENLKEAPTSALIPVFRAYSKTELAQVSFDIINKANCFHSDLYVAAAAAHEIHFPEPAVVASAQSLLQKVVTCNQDGLAAYASYKTGIFSIWNHDCKSGHQHLKNALAAQAEPYFKSRATYWKNFCAKQMKLSDIRQPASFYNEFPISFHPLVELENDSFSPFNKIKNNSEPELKFRSKNHQLNDTILLTEAFLQMGQTHLASQTLQRLDRELIEQEDPSVLLYVAYLAHKTNLNLVNFQILSKLYQKNEDFRSISTLKLLYPTTYSDIVKKYSAQVDPVLILSLIRQESAFATNARSNKGARGLMQILPSTAGRKISKASDLFRPEKNIEVGVQYLARLLNRYDGRVHLALAAYNAGALYVDAWVKRYPTDNDLLFMELIPFRETRDYVASIMRNYYWYKNLYADENWVQPKTFAAGAFK